MTILEQRFLEAVPSQLKDIAVGLGTLNENLSKIATLLEGRRTSTSSILQDSILSEESITNSKAAANLLREELSHQDHEEFWVVLLGQDLRPHRKFMLCSGNLTTTIIDHRRVVKEALGSNATAVLAYHNHPSDSLLPSESDIQATTQLRQALSLFDITLVDHIIIGSKGFYSFADEKEQSF